MKKTLLFAMIGLGVATLCSCGSKSNPSIDLKEPMSLSKLEIAKDYKTACELKEFSTAYEFVDKLKKVTSEKKLRQMKLLKMQRMACLLP